MEYVIDTGVLIRAFEISDPHHLTVRRLLKRSRQAGWQLVTFHQNIAEQYVVSTRPVESNGYGQTVEETMVRIHFLERIGIVKHGHDAAHEQWKKLIAEYQVLGKSAHDTRIVAQMLSSVSYT